MAATRFLVYVVMFVVCTTSCSSLKLPSYIKPCSRNDPDINACVLRRGRESLAEIAKKAGDRKYNIPSISPLLVTEIHVNQNGLDLTFKDVKVYGLDNSILTEATVDFKAKREGFEITIPRMELIADYVISGKILFLPIQGVGPANVTIPNLKVVVGHDYDLKKGKTGKDHLVTKNPTLKIVGKTTGTLKFDNLFGNKELSDNMNQVLNDNVEEILADVAPAVAQALGLVVDQIFVGIGNVVPFDDMYPVSA